MLMDESTFAAALGRIEQKIDGLDTRLFDAATGVIVTTNNNVATLAKRMDDKEKWERIHNTLHYAIAPVIVALHAIARQIGVEI